MERHHFPVGMNVTREPGPFPEGQWVQKAAILLVPALSLDVIKETLEEESCAKAQIRGCAHLSSQIPKAEFDFNIFLLDLTLLPCEGAAGGEE